jgi:hypothetical protein
MIGRAFTFGVFAIWLCCVMASAQQGPDAERAGLDDAVAAVRRSLPSGSIAYVLRTAYGDVTYDGITDAAVLVRREDVPWGIRDHIWIFELRGNRYALISDLSLNRPHEYVMSIAGPEHIFAIGKGVLIFNHAIVTDRYRPPTRYKTVKYQWNGKAMIRVAASTLKPLPEHMREVG